MAKEKVQTTDAATIIKNGQKASKRLAAYLKEHKLDPKKDWTKHPEHGAFIKKQLKKIKLGEEMAVEKTSTKAEKAKNLKKPETQPKVKTVKSAPTSYNYPDIDGQPMSPDLKKKFRQKMRTLTKGGLKTAEAEKKALESLMGGAVKDLKKKAKTTESAKKEPKAEKKSSGKKSTKADPKKPSTKASKEKGPKKASKKEED